MKKKLTFAILGLVLLSGCTKGLDMPEPEPTPTPDPTPVDNRATQEEIDANVKKVFGITFSADQVHHFCDG